MSDAGQGSPSEGWYSIEGNPNDLAYFDGRFWTWRRQRDLRGEWHQGPIVPPTATAPAPGVPQSTTPRAVLPYGPSATPTNPYTGMPTYPGGTGHELADSGQWGGGPPPHFRPPGRLDLHLPEPTRQARWRTLLRGLLVIPNAVVLALLELAMFFVTVLMWFAALFTARVPESLWGFSIDVVKWQARTYAYTYFLSDRYPPFKLGDAQYPVSITLAGPPDRFNRFSVLFRIILVIPAAIVVEVFTWGVAILSIPTWLITAIGGRCPRPLHLVIAAWLRYSLRLTAFQLLLTTDYPSAPLGDQAPIYGAPSLQDGIIVLSGAAKALAIAALVIGTTVYVGNVVVNDIVARHSTLTSLRTQNSSARPSSFDIAGAPGYETYAGPAGLPMQEGRPWGTRCQPIVFSADELPEDVYRQVRQVVQDARADGIDVTIDNNHNRWSPTTLYPRGLTNTDVEFVTVSANAVTSPRLATGHIEHIDFSWGASPSPNGKNEFITGLTATLYLKNMDGSLQAIRHSARQLVAFSEGVWASTVPGSGIARGSQVDAFSPKDIAAMQLMGGCR